MGQRRNAKQRPEPTETDCRGLDRKGSAGLKWIVLQGTARQWPDRKKSHGSGADGNEPNGNEAPGVKSN